MAVDIILSIIVNIVVIVITPVSSHRRQCQVCKSFLREFKDFYFIVPCAGFF